MPVNRQDCVEQRSHIRRQKDRVYRDRMRRYEMLFELCQLITSEMSLDVLFELIMVQINQLMHTERCSVFLHNTQEQELWSLVSTEMGKDAIRFPISQGVAGWVFRHNSALIINDPYSDPRFLADVDKKTGFRTRNILCLPLINRKQQCIGILQTLNIKRESGFSQQDLELLTSASAYVTIALENARLYEELKALDKARERAINHLSHELRTPLAILSGVLHRVHRSLEDTFDPKLVKALARGERNVERLRDLQTKIDDILNHKFTREQHQITRLLEDALWFVEEVAEEGSDEPREEMLERICRRLESLYKAEPACMEEISLDAFLSDICADAVQSMGYRNMEIIRNFEKDTESIMDRRVLYKVCLGLLKNAIENTPDEGTIEVRTRSNSRDEVCIEFRDYGVGITEQNQPLIFNGFFHTQETALYATKKPYAFNAGGSGADLLRTRVFSERFGFSVKFESTRCRFLPTDSDTCPGKISDCPFIRDRKACRSSGGSQFSITLPHAESS